MHSRVTKRREKEAITSFPLIREAEGGWRDGPGLSVIIPIGGKDRTHHLQKVLQSIHAQNYEPYEVLISEYGTGPKYYAQHYSEPTRYLYTEGGPKFNKAIAMNKAFMAARYQICVLVDADIVLPRKYLRHIAVHMEGFDACFLLKRVLHTWVIQKLKHNQMPPVSSIRSDNFNGASLAVTKDAYERIGGMCEEFEGYGYEDLEFWDRLRRLCTLNKDRRFDVLHLDHKHPAHYDKEWVVNQKIWVKLAGIAAEVRAETFRQALQKYKQ